jgi:hypothetical protein
LGQLRSVVLRWELVTLVQAYLSRSRPDPTR